MDKICRKVVKIYQNDLNEITLSAQANSSYHLYYVMDAEPVKTSSYKEKLNIADVIINQISALVADCHLNVNSLIYSLCD